ncbi:MAG: ATP-binding protein [Thermomicrobiales bacterium]|nr:ATP-binding protein [Thermomicrobiales bacterium]
MTSRELPEERSQGVLRRRVPFLFSVRFGITAWYAGVLIITLSMLGIGLRVLLIRSLDQDAENRLSNAARDVSTQVSERPTGNANLYQLDNSPTLDLQNILFSGVSVTVVDFTTNEVTFDDGTLSNLWPTQADIERYKTSNEPTLGTYRVNGYAIRGYTLPIVSEHVVDPRTGVHMVIGMIFTSESLSGTTHMLQQLSQALILFGVIGGATASIGGWSLAGRALAPVNRFIDGADDIAKDRTAASLSRRLDVPQTGDELAELGNTFNDMLDRIEQAFKTQQRFVADASHELRTPLTSIKGNVDVVRRQLSSGREIDPRDLADALGDVSRESERMSRLVSDLLSLARTDGNPTRNLNEHDVVSLDLLAREAIRTAEVLVDKQVLVLTSEGEVLIHGDGDALVQVMLILLDNAIRHTPGEGTVSLTIREDIDPQDKVRCARIDVDDTGCGIAPQHLPHLFERFYRAEDHRARSSGGTGLGLSIALSIVRAHKGWIDVASTPGEGTNFTVWLPQRFG